MTKKPARAAPAPTGAAPAPTGATKTPIVESASIPLDVWQGLTGEQIKTILVTQKKGAVGVDEYYKTSQPVAIGDTGFYIWGLTEYGTPVVSTKDPGSYDSWEWMT